MEPCFASFIVFRAFNPLKAKRLGIICEVTKIRYL